MIADTFIKRPITAIVISLILVIVGTLAILNLPVSQYPDITPPVVQISSQYIGADATTVEQTVTTPIEIQVNGAPGMNFIQSNSTNDGRSSINVFFDIGTNVDIATTEVQNRVNIATPVLPDQVKRLGITVRRRIQVHFYWLRYSLRKAHITFDFLIITRISSSEMLF